MKRVFLLPAILTMAAVVTFGQATSLEGEWVAVSASTRGITRIVIAPERDGYTVEAWGKCHPNDCEWGKVILTAVGDSVEDNSFTRGFAVWEPGFASKYLVFSLDRRMLRVQTVTIFRDRSRRASYRIVEYLRRSEETIP
jgi:hypothetical protein